MYEIYRVICSSIFCILPVTAYCDGIKIKSVWNILCIDWGDNADWRGISLHCNIDTALSLPEMPKTVRKLSVYRLLHNCLLHFPVIKLNKTNAFIPKIAHKERFYCHAWLSFCLFVVSLTLLASVASQLHLAEKSISKSTRFCTLY